LEPKKTCWFCLGHSKKTFSFAPPAPAQTTVDIHLACEDFHGETMQQLEENSVYTTSKFLAPGKHMYYFSYDGERSMAPYPTTTVPKTDYIANIVKSGELF